MTNETFRPAAVAAALLLASASCEPPGPTPLEWVAVEEGLAGAIMSVWGPSATDLYAVGGTLEPDGGDALILRRDTDGWWSMTSDAPTLWWVHGFAADDVWAVGEHGVVTHFDGTAWTTVDGGLADYTLWGIWGATSSELWAVGGSAIGATPGILRRWDGAAWTDVTGLDLGGIRLFKVWGSAADDVFVVGDGQDATILHWDGAAWSFMDAGLDTGVNQRLITVYGRGADDVYAVGGLSEPILLRWDGSAWSRIETGLKEGLMALWTAPGHPVLVAGFVGVLALGEVDEDGAWTWTPQESGTSDCLHAAWGDDAGAMLLGGGDLLGIGPRTGLLVGTGGVVGGPVSPWPGP